MYISETQVERLIEALEGINESTGLPPVTYKIEELLQSIAEALHRLADHG